LYENKDRIFSLNLSEDENYLMAVIFKGFRIFSFRSYLWKTCLLPGSVRNIMSGTKRLTYTAAFSQDNRYCIACVKSSVYLFEIEWGDLVASFDSHFGRILVVKCLSTGSGGNNYVITTGMDKTTKVWNLQNAKEKSISIAQLDKSIEMMHISTETRIILAQSRTQLYLFNMRSGLMIGQLSVNPHGSIYQCTVLCTNGLFAASAESNNFVIYDIEERKTSFITPLKNVAQLLLHSAETMILVLTTEVVPTQVSSASNNGPVNTSPNGQTVRAISYGIPDGDLIYEILSNMKRSNQPKNVACTTDDTYFVFIEEKKNSEILALYDPMTGEHVHNIKLNYPAYKEITLMVTIPKQPYLIGLIDSEKGIVMNVRDKKIHLTLPKWGGQISSDGKYGLYAPTRGGLEIFEFRTGKVVRTLIGKVAEGVFEVLTFFTPTNNHVIYYHKGKRTIRVFRTQDGRQIADMKCPTKVRQAIGTHDGRALVVGYEDGAVQVFLIVDHFDESTVDYLKRWRKRQFPGKLESIRQETAEKKI
ncbi:unnamed protein product, partial [Rotaria sp. Silwood2]